MKLLNKSVLFAFAFSAVSSVALAAGGAEGSGAAGGAAGAGAGTAEGGAGAAEGGAGAAAGGETSFSSIDKNADGYVDAEEASGVSGLDMGTADTDGDGRLSPTEFEAAVQAGASGGAGAPGTSPGEAGGAGGSGMGEQQGGEQQSR